MVGIFCFMLTTETSITIILTSNLIYFICLFVNSLSSLTREPAKKTTFSVVACDQVKMYFISIKRKTALVFLLHFLIYKMNF